jgi:hypothetical protein
MEVLLANTEVALELLPSTYMLGYIKNESRADWHIILPLDQNATVLDIESAWGIWQKIL